MGFGWHRHGDRFHHINRFGNDRVGHCRGNRLLLQMHLRHIASQLIRRKVTRRNLNRRNLNRRYFNRR